MDDKRKGEIALVLLREKVRKEGIRVFPDAFERDLGNLSNGTGVPKNELRKFFEEEYQLVFGEMFNKKEDQPRSRRNKVGSIRSLKG